jgi:hypothetical protein
MFLVFSWSVFGWSLYYETSRGQKDSHTDFQIVNKNLEAYFCFLAHCTKIINISGKQIIFLLVAQ